MKEFDISKRVLLVGATGYIGRHVANRLVKQGYKPVCPLRSINPKFAQQMKLSPEQTPIWDLKNKSSVNNVFARYPDLCAIISCVASRTGGIRDSWLVDFELNMNILTEAKSFNINNFVLLSAICVQKPMLNFQWAKLTFENKLQSSGLDYTIVRPTAFFKSLAGQIKRVQNGKKFILFDDGTQTSTKPISERDLAFFLVQCINNKNRKNKILSIGGPGPVRTQKDLGDIIFKLLNKSPKYFHMPSNVFKILATLISPLGLISTKMRDKAEFLRIAHYYATESMLFWNEKIKQYSPEETIEVGKDTIENFYKSIIENDTQLVKDKEQKLFE